MITLKLFASTLAVFLSLEILWLGFIAKSFFMNCLGPIGRIENGEFKIIYGAAAIVYLLMAASLIYFVLPRVSRDQSLLVAAGWGALMGLCVYGVFDFTNYAILKDYPLSMVLVDMSWGTFLYAVTTAAVKFLRDQFFVS